MVCAANGGSLESRSQKVTGGVGFGNKFNDEPIQLRKLNLGRLKRQAAFAEDPFPLQPTSAVVSGCYH